MHSSKVLIGCLVFCGVLILLCAAALTVIIFVYGKSDTAKSTQMQKTKCESHGCVRTAAQIVSYIDESIDPCEDFYHFANGRYIREIADEAEESSSQNFFTDVSKLVQKKIGPLLSEPSHHNEWRAITMAKNFYKSCLKQSTIVKRKNQQLIDILDSLGGWPVVSGNSSKFNLIELIRKLSSLGLNTNSIFTLNVGVDLKNTTNRRLEIKKEIEKRSKTFDDRYKNKMLKTANLFINLTDETAKANVKTEMDQVWEFENKLINYLQYSKNDSDYDDDNDDDNVLYPTTTIREFDYETDENNVSIETTTVKESDSDLVSDILIAYAKGTTTVKELQTQYQYLNWLDYINAILPPGLDVTPNEPIINLSPLFFESLGEILKLTSNRTLANYIVWRAIYDIYEMEEKEIGKKRRAICIDLTSDKFSIPVTLLYSRKYFNETSRQAVVDLVEDVRSTFIHMLDDVSWMDNDTRTKAIEKAKNIVSHVGYSNRMFELHVLHEYYGRLETMEPKNYFKNVLRWNAFNNNQMFESLRRPANRSGWEATIDLKPNEANAFYDPVSNSIQFPIAILHEKFFSVDRPNYFNYATLGMTIGHEITHGFDNSGRRFDLNGNLVDWWDSKTKNEFVENSKCFVQQYSNYTDSKTGLNVDGEKTLNENIADNGGIRAAYYAYQNWVNRNGPEKLVPGIKYNQKQLFWIAYAQSEGAVIGETNRIIQIVLDGHALGEFRVKGIVSNSPEFAKDFNCAEGTKMNPIRKCKIW